MPRLHNITASINNLIDKQFLSSIKYDHKETAQEVSTSVASINTRDIASIFPTHNVYPTIDIAEEFRIDAKPFINRPFYLGSVDFSSTADQYSLLPFSQNILPLSVLNSNPSLMNAVKLGAYYRSDLTLNISLAGTITHAGCVLVGILPPLATQLNNSPQPFLVNTLLTGPHCFLHANEATSATLHVPWMCNTDLASLDLSVSTFGDTTTLPSYDVSTANGNHGTLVMMVLNPLAVSDGSSTSLGIVVEAIFNSLDILVPSPRYIMYSQSAIMSVMSGVVDEAFSYAKSTIADGIDSMRAGVKAYTGLHNPNYAKLSNKYVVTTRNYANLTDSTQFFEKLDPLCDVDRIMQGPDFHTLTDEMDIQHIIGKPQYVDTFRTKTSHPIGKLLMSRPISPYSGSQTREGMQYFSNNIQMMHLLSRGWRGTIRIHIQSVMNNKQQIKLRLIQLYNPSAQAASGFPKYETVLNAPSHLMEFTAGGQTQTIDLPYLCRNKITPTMLDSSGEGLFHGMFYIYVAQTLANSGGSPEEVNFNVFMSLGDDFKFYGYATENAISIPPVNAFVQTMESESFPLAFPSLPPSSLSTLPKFSISCCNTTTTYYEPVYTPPSLPREMISESLDVMNTPQDQGILTSNHQTEDASESFSDRLVPYKNMRDIIRRMYKYTSYDIAITTGPLGTGTGLIEIPLSSLIGEMRGVSTPVSLVAGMYYGKSCGFKLRVKLRNSANLLVRYVPQSVFPNSSLNNFSPTQVDITNSVLNEEFASGSTFPIPFLEIPVVKGYAKGDTQVYEFTVPNTSYYKFMGAPNKLTGTPSLTTLNDFGSLFLSFETVNAIATLPVSVIFGLTDESRLGMHFIAPIVYVPQKEGRFETLHSGSYGDMDMPPQAIDNPYMFFTN